MPPDLNPMPLEVPAGAGYPQLPPGLQMPPPQHPKGLHAHSQSTRTLTNTCRDMQTCSYMHICKQASMHTSMRAHTDRTQPLRNARRHIQARSQAGMHTHAQDTNSQTHTGVHALTHMHAWTRTHTQASTCAYMCRDSQTHAQAHGYTHAHRQACTHTHLQDRLTNTQMCNPTPACTLKHTEASMHAHNTQDTETHKRTQTCTGAWLHTRMHTCTQNTDLGHPGEIPKLGHGTDVPARGHHVMPGAGAGGARAPGGG